MPEKPEKNQGKSRFISTVLGAVQPTNILTEYFSCFRGHKKFKAYFLSWLDGEIYKKLLQGKPPWVYVVCQELADKFGCCRDTVQRHLRDLCDAKVLNRLPYKRWATDNIWQYTINFDHLAALWLDEYIDKIKQFQSCISKSAFLGRYWIGLLSKAENQTTVSMNSDSRLSEFRQPTVESSSTYTNTNPSPSSIHTQTDDVDAEEKTDEEETEELHLAPTDEEMGQALCEIRALSPEFQLNLNVKRAIFLNWANLPAVLTYLKEAVRSWKVRPDFNWTGLLVKSLKSGVAKEYEPPPKEYPRPTLEQLNVLGTIGKLVYTRFDEPGHPEVLCVEVEGRGLLTWWKALEIPGGAV